MKKSFLILATLATVMMTACTTDGAGEYLTVELTPPAEPQQVVLTFSPYTTEAMTRAAQSVSAFATRLDIWLFEDGAEVTSVHQTKDDDGFGTLTLTLDRRKTYTLYALAHRSTEATTLEDGIARWKDDKVTHTFYCTETFCPADKQTLACLMQRIVGQFRLEITDDIPEGMASIRFSISQTATRYNIVTGENANITDRTTDITYGGKSSTFILYLLAADDEPTQFGITVTALDQDGQPLQQRQFADVPIQNGYQTTYRGEFFTDAPAAATFTVADWQAFDTVEF